MFEGQLGEVVLKSEREEGIRVHVDAEGKDAYALLQALGNVKDPNAHPKRVAVVVMTVGPVVNQ